MLYGMADPIKEVLISRSASASASTRPTANCCRAWRTSSAGCWRTRRTTRSCGPASRDDVPEEVLLMNPQIKRGRRNGVSRQPKSVDAERHSFRLRAPHSPFHNEPLADFSPGANRAAMQAALDAVRRQFGQHLPGRDRQPAGADAATTLDSREPVAHERGRRPVRPGDVPSRRTRRSPPPEGVRRRGATRRSTSGPDSCGGRPTRFRERRFELAAWIVLRDAASRGARPTPTWPRPSTSATTTRREMLTPGDAAAPRRAGRGQRLLLRAARRGGGHRAVELPARHPRAAWPPPPLVDGQHGRHEAGRAVVGHRARS